MSYLEDSYFEHLLEEEAERLLIRSLLTATGLVFISALVQAYLVFSIATSCSTVFGLTISGKVLETDSFTCQNPFVESVHQQGNRL